MDRGRASKKEEWEANSRVPSKRVAMVSRKVFWGARRPLITGILGLARGPPRHHRPTGARKKAEEQALQEASPTPGPEAAAGKEGNECPQVKAGKRSSSSTHAPCRAEPEGLQEEEGGRVCVCAPSLQLSQPPELAGAQTAAGGRSQRRRRRRRRRCQARGAQVPALCWRGSPT